MLSKKKRSVVFLQQQQCLRFKTKTEKNQNVIVHVHIDEDFSMNLKKKIQRRSYPFVMKSLQ